MAADGLVRMAALAVLPRVVEHKRCPLCDGDLLVLVLGWSTDTEALEVETGGYCDARGCDTFVIEGPDDDPA
jgi:hypothetical protein